MPFLTQYQLQFQNNEGQLVTINISDTESGSGTPTPIPLTCTGAELIVVNDDEDKFSTIKGKRVEFSFKSTISHHLSVFIDPTDNKWLVEALIGTTQIFSGWLVTDATREAFLPPETYVVSLTASDNLGLLKDLPLTKPDGTNPRGRFRLIEYVSWCLKKTGFNLPINVVFNLKPEGFATSDHAFDEVYLQAKTFEADINESIDCYEVLQRLLKGGFLTQENNEWWIIRVDEMNGGSYKVYNYDADGVLLGDTTATLTKDIGKAETIKFISKDAEVMPERPVLYDKLTYHFDFPREIVDNGDFSRGTTWLSPVVVDMSFYIKIYANLGAFPAVGELDKTYKATDTGTFYKWSGTAYVAITGAEIPQGFAYVVDDWTLGRYSANSVTSPGATTTSAYIDKIRQYGDEKARYLHITNTTEGNPFTYLRSSPIPVGSGDKAIVSVDFRRTTNAGTSNVGVFAVVLNGDNGVNYVWAAGPGLWNPATIYGTAAFDNTYTYPAGANRTDWASFSTDMKPFPVSGELYILLLAAYVGSGSHVHYSNLQFQYIPYINGSYQKYNSLYNKVSQAISTKNIKEEQVYLYDRIRPLFKGSLELKTAGGQYYAINGWFDENLGTGGGLTIASFGKYQAFDYWNQNRRIIRKFQGTLKGLDSATELPGLLHQYSIVTTTANEHSENKVFILLSYSQNLDTCEWTGIFAELNDTTDPKIYNSTHELKFITDNG